MGKTKRAANATPNYLVSNAKVANNSEKSKGFLGNISLSEAIAIRVLSNHSNNRKTSENASQEHPLAFVVEALESAAQLLAVAAEDVKDFIKNQKGIAW